ncbi:hypothetical protein NHF48_017650 [Sphingomonas sp. H160509]|uniref:hypothetical protein n=1 Tax=Sphingomonas sp. H160509 TaxID=2955313 RepID=UPI002096B6C3|nr:hypothetical protein [Sphingomonas sp. H160509]MDD1452333.1 hypothetical protein [Sphingomonas sp. H160509]
MAAKSAFCLIAALLASAAPAIAQTSARTASTDLTLNAAGYYEAPAANVLVFSNWYDGLFADSKISGVEIIQQGERIATNGDVRLSSTPGQWDAIGRLVDRKIDAATGAIIVTLEYPDYKWRYRVRSEKRGGAVAVSVILDQPVPAALAGKAGFNLEFLPRRLFPPQLHGGRSERRVPGLSGRRDDPDAAAQRRERARGRPRRRTDRDRQGQPLRARARGSGTPRDDPLDRRNAVVRRSQPGAEWLVRAPLAAPGRGAPAPCSNGRSSPTAYRAGSARR